MNITIFIIIISSLVFLMYVVFTRGIQIHKLKRNLEDAELDIQMLKRQVIDLNSLFEKAEQALQECVLDGVLTKEQQERFAKKYNLEIKTPVGRPRKNKRK